MCLGSEWLGVSAAPLTHTLIRSGSHLIMINAAEMNGNANAVEVAPA